MFSCFVQKFVSIYGVFVKFDMFVVIVFKFFFKLYVNISLSGLWIYKVILNMIGKGGNEEQGKGRDNKDVSQ